MNKSECCNTWKPAPTRISPCTEASLLLSWLKLRHVKKASDSRNNWRPSSSSSFSLGDSATEELAIFPGEEEFSPVSLLVLVLFAWFSWVPFSAKSELCSKTRGSPLRLFSPLPETWSAVSAGDINGSGVVGRGGTVVDSAQRMSFTGLTLHFPLKWKTINYAYFLKFPNFFSSAFKANY